MQSRCSPSCCQSSAFSLAKRASAELALSWGCRLSNMFCKAPAGSCCHCCCHGCWAGKNSLPSCFAVGEMALKTAVPPKDRETGGMQELPPFAMTTLPCSALPLSTSTLAARAWILLRVCCICAMRSTRTSRESRSRMNSLSVAFSCCSVVCTSAGGAAQEPSSDGLPTTGAEYGTACNECIVAGSSRCTRSGERPLRGDWDLRTATVVTGTIAAGSCTAGTGV
mmetsp:Transcript_96830/g.269285  ORF Transcript_96830/g.269285 Transcript_96830/m.269285 type:complete len:224 (+) Transcript_96830:1228-1899(+)